MIANRIKLLLLDLDNTLWDFDANADAALTELFHRHHLHMQTGLASHQFVELYKVVNKSYWKRYETGEIDKEFLRTARFTETFIKMGIPESEHPENIWEEYLSICPLMTGLVPGALEFLEAMQQHFRIGLVTNGFESTQTVKIQNSGISTFVDFMVTSESVGIAKPNAAIFEHALKLGRATKEQAMYIGDTWDTDVAGGIQSGIITWWFNKEKASLPAGTYASHPLFGGHSSTLLELSKAVLVWPNV